MDDLLSEFLTETNESLEILDTELVVFEQDPSDLNVLGNIFRLMHTIKGTCGFLGLPRLESVAHAGENVLGNFREGKVSVTPDAVTSILNCIDRIRELLQGLEETGQESDQGDDSALVDQLNKIAGGGQITEDNAPVSEGDEDVSAKPSNNEFGAPVSADLLAEVAAADAATAEEAEVEIKVEDAVENSTAVVTLEPKDKPVSAKSGKEASISNSSIRVTVDVLENLMTLVSELVLTRNQLLQMVRGVDESEFSVPLQRLSHITSDLQEGVMKTRMQPIGNAWSKLPRIVRDLAVETEKKIDLDMSGQETELDRQVLELIKDPLTHMVRNSADHGLEQPADRVAAGKPETGVVSLKAYHEGGHIIINISDDGRGLNTDLIREKVVDRELATRAEVAAMDDREVQQFIFKAGFSTAAAVTSVSGRGVGMDVVRTNIESIGGTVELNSVSGKGSTFTIKIPLTLAIVSALVVACGNERFAIPQINVQELVRSGTNSEHTIEMINDSPVLRLRDRLLPLISLRELLHISPEDDVYGGGKQNVVDLVPGPEHGGEAKDGRNAAEQELAAAALAEDFIVVAQVGSNTFGIIVDKVFDTEEIVVKPVAPILRDIPFYSGNTILGDGSVIMILDPNGVSASIGKGVATKDAAISEDQVIADTGESSAFLVFRAGNEQPMAVPLGLIARLEEFDASQIETADDQRVIQYRGKLMPLATVRNTQEIKVSGNQPVIVFSDGDRSMGLIVDEIIDIVEDTLDTQLQTDTPNLLGSSVFDGKASDVIDVSHYLTRAFSDWFERPEKRLIGNSSVGKRILLVDDSQFFRELLAPFLTVGGYKVTTAVDAVEALKLRDKGIEFDAIISDIEMPHMSGFEFGEAIREGGIWKDTPILALSSTLDDMHVKRSREIGFNDYIAKTDRTNLLQALTQILNRYEDAA